MKEAALVSNSERVRRGGVLGVVMAGGRGVRMRSAGTKMLMPILGRPLVEFPVRLALDVISGPVVVVVGDYLAEVRNALAGLPEGGRLRFAHQEQPLGTADALRAGLGELLPEDHCEWVLVLNGDVPATAATLLERLMELAIERNQDLTFVTMKLEDPTGYGRVLRDESGRILAIREERELTGDDKDVRVVNAGLYCVRTKLATEFLKTVKRSPRQGEFLLTDIVEWVAVRSGKVGVVQADDPVDVQGVNNRAELAEVTARIRRERNRGLMLAGVSMPDPESVDVEFGVEVGKDTLLERGVSLQGSTFVGEGCVIGTGSVISNCRISNGVKVLPYCVLESTEIGEGCSVGPFAHTRPGTKLEKGAKLGNFVETKMTVIGEGSKANHLTYLGDAVIGKGVNIGAGTITCNYDGYRKYKTIIEDEVFVGSDTQFVAPVRVGRGAIVAAGTTVTKDVPENALAIARVEQENREGYAAQRRLRKSRK